MKIESFGVVDEVQDPADLDAVLMRRCDPDVNEFWLSHQDPFPAMSILVKGDLASLHYFAGEGEPGFRSIGTISKQDCVTLFCTESPKHIEPVLNKFVVSFTVALAAAKEFLRSRSLPRSVDWMEL